MCSVTVLMDNTRSGRVLRLTARRRRSRLLIAEMAERWSLTPHKRPLTRSFQHYLDRLINNTTVLFHRAGHFPGMPVSALLSALKSLGWAELAATCQETELSGHHFDSNDGIFAAVDLRYRSKMPASTKKGSITCYKPWPQYINIECI